MVYRDRWWCPFYENCKDGIGCNRALTREVKEAAERWWGSRGAPIDTPVKEPKCFKKK